MHYLACAPLFDAPVLWKGVEEGWLRFDVAAGETLLLTPIARFALDQLTRQRQSADDLVRAVLQEEPEAQPDDCRHLVNAAIAALLAAQLIRATPP